MEDARSPVGTPVGAPPCKQSVPRTETGDADGVELMRRPTMRAATLEQLCSGDGNGPPSLMETTESVERTRCKTSICRSPELSAGSPPMPALPPGGGDGTESRANGDG
jgi:hypothetical protein